MASSWLCDYFMELQATKRYLKSSILMHVLKISWKYIESSHQNLNLHQFVMCGCFFHEVLFGAFKVEPSNSASSSSRDACVMSLWATQDQGATHWSMSSWVIVCSMFLQGESWQSCYISHYFVKVSQKKTALTVWCLCFRLLCKGHKGNAFGLVTPHWRNLNVLTQSEWQASPGSYRPSNI